jgi:alanine racemase
VALRNGVTRLAVARLGEGIALHQAGCQAPILILGYTDPGDYPLVIAHRLTQTIYSPETAVKLSDAACNAGQVAQVHIKVDSGMGRLGFIAGSRDAVREILAVSALPHLDLEGIFTHFAKADSHDKSYAHTQWERFTGMLDLLAAEGLTFRIRHAANSAATIELPDTHLNLVRVGLAMYGYYPSQEDAAMEQERLALTPAMSWKAIVCHVKQVPPGTGIGYGISYTTTAATTVATVTAGYADGYNRLLSNRGTVLIHGRRCPVIGRVCMDQIIVDAGHVPDVKTGDEVVLIGSQGSEAIGADEIALQLDTIPYEILCGVSARVPRYYKKSAGCPVPGAE